MESIGLQKPENLLLREEHKKQIPRYARNDRPGGTFMSILGPKVHAALSMTQALFHQLANAAHSPWAARYPA